MELVKRREIGGKSCWLYRVEFVDELVQVVGRLHDRAKQGHESHVVALERSFHICVTSTLKKIWKPVCRTLVWTCPAPAPASDGKERESTKYFKIGFNHKMLQTVWVCQVLYLSHDFVIVGKFSLFYSAHIFQDKPHLGINNQMLNWQREEFKIDSPCLPTS